MGNHKRKTKSYFVAPEKQARGPKLSGHARKAKRRQKRWSLKPAQWMFWIVSIAALLGAALNFYCHFNEHRPDPGHTINVTQISTSFVIITQPQKLSRP